MSLLLTTRRGVKRAYEEILSNGKKAIEQVLYGTVDESRSATFLLDRIIRGGAIRVRTRKPNQEGETRDYFPGTGSLYKLPIMGIKTPLDEEMSDEAIAGYENTAAWAEQQMGLFNRIARNQSEDIGATKAEAAWQPLLEGKISFKNIDNSDFEIDLGRSATLSQTKSYASADVYTSLSDAYSPLAKFNPPKGQMIAVYGSDFLGQLMNSTVFADKLKQIQGTQGMTQLPESLQNSDIHIVGKVVIPGTCIVCMIACYDPPYGGIKATPDASAVTSIIDPDEMVMFPLDGKRFLVRRGLNYFDMSAKKARSNGNEEVVIDGWVPQGEPMVEMIRTQSREIYVPGNVNHCSRVSASAYE